MNSLSESKAQMLLMELMSQAQPEFAGAKTMTLAQALNPLAIYATGDQVVITGNAKIVWP